MDTLNKSINTNKKITIGDFAISKYSNRIPVVVHYLNPTISNNYYHNLLIRNDSTIGNLIVMLRQKNKISHNELIIIILNNKMVDEFIMIKDLYDKYKKNEDGCLHLNVQKENTLIKWK